LTEGSTTIIVRGPDVDGSLASMTSALNSFGCSVLDASATNGEKEGTIEDKFVIVDSKTKEAIDDDKLEELANVILDATRSPSSALKAYIHKLEEKVKKLEVDEDPVDDDPVDDDPVEDTIEETVDNPTDEHEDAFDIEVSNILTEGSTTIIVRGPDVDGSLASMTSALNSFGCSVLDLQQIVQNEGTIEDKFVIVDSKTKEAIDDDKLDELANVILDATRSLPPALKAKHLRSQADSLYLPPEKKYHVFLTHNWGENDENHQRVSKINHELKMCGVRTWFDEERLGGNIIEEISSGIDSSLAIIVFITQAYVTKVSGNGRKGNDDYCKLEFEYAQKFMGVDNMIVVECEETDERWSGNLEFFLGNHFKYNFKSDDKLTTCVEGLVKKIRERIEVFSSS